MNTEPTYIEAHHTYLLQRMAFLRPTKNEATKSAYSLVKEIEILCNEALASALEHNIYVTRLSIKLLDSDFLTSFEENQLRVVAEGTDRDSPRSILLNFAPKPLNKIMTNKIMNDKPTPETDAVYPPEIIDREFKHEGHSWGWDKVERVCTRIFFRLRRYRFSRSRKRLKKVIDDESGMV